MPPKKKVLAIVKIQLPAGGATPAPPVGTALGPHGVQTMEFCKQYNAATENQRGQIIPVEITHLRGPVVLLRPEDAADPGPVREAAGLEKGAAPARAGSRSGSITDAQLDRDRQDQASRPQHRRHRGRQAPGGGHGTLDGRHRRG